ncbi:MAG: hypothetical protein M3M94_00795 [Actinomycetota bacterium]|nr:hypothetical protein [Actinomycetota bacterium]
MKRKLKLALAAADGRVAGAVAGISSLDLFVDAAGRLKRFRRGRRSR